MYDARIETEAGQTFYLGYSHGNIFDIDPLSGVDVNLSTSQGFQQVGQTVETQSVDGVSRTIRGTFIQNGAEMARRLMRALPIFTKGRLFFNDTRFCEFYVSKTPYTFREKGGRYIFNFRIFCPSLYWQDAQLSKRQFGGIRKAFHFPVVFTKHIYGDYATPEFQDYINCENNSPVDVPIEVTFRTNSRVENYGLQNLYTLEKLLINDILEAGESVTFKRVGPRLALEKDGQDMFSALDDASNLFWLHPGDNVLTAIGGASKALSISVQYREVEMGVIE